MEPTQVSAPERRLTHSAVSMKPLAAAVIALAAVIFGGWPAFRSAAAAVFFGFASALVIRLPQGGITA